MNCGWSTYPLLTPPPEMAGLTKGLWKPIGFQGRVLWMEPDTFNLAVSEQCQWLGRFWDQHRVKAIQKVRRNPWKSCFLGEEVKFIFGGIPEPPNSQLTICWFLLRVYSFQYLYPRNPLAGHLVNRQLEVFKEYLDPSSVQHILRFETLASGLARHEDLYLFVWKKHRVHGWKLLLNFQVPGRNVRGSGWCSCEEK